MVIKALNKMSLKELKAQRAEVDAAISNFEERRINDAKKAIEAVAKEHGVSIGDIYGAGKKRRKAKAAAKFANPDNGSETWSGRGRQPAWYKTAVSDGKSPESMEI